MMNALRYYRVKYGDTLATLGIKFYGNAGLGIVIYNHNKHYIANPNVLYPGQTIVIPYISAEDTVII